MEEGAYSRKYGAHVSVNEKKAQQKKSLEGGAKIEK